MFRLACRSGDLAFALLAEAVVLARIKAAVTSRCARREVEAAARERVSAERRHLDAALVHWLDTRELPSPALSAALATYDAWRMGQDNRLT